jgi:hypothetical protein
MRVSSRAVRRSDIPIRVRAVISGAGEVLVSQTVRELVAGSGLQFDDG